MVKDVGSAFFDRLQGDVNIVDMIALDHPGLSRRWTSDTQPVTSSGETYVPFHGLVEGYGEETSDLSVAVANFMFGNENDEFAPLLKASNFDAADVLAFRVFPDTPDLGRLEVFRGKIGDISYTRNEISVQVRNQWGSAEQEWPRFTYKDTCTLRFGGTACGVDTSSFTVPFSTSNITSGNTLQVTMVTSTLVQSYANGAFDYGRVTFTDGPNSGEVRTVRAHSGDVIDMSHGLPFSAVSGGFTVFPGCRKRLIQDCTSLYDNQANFLGWPWIPIMEDRGTDEGGNTQIQGGAAPEGS